MSDGLVRKEFRELRPFALLGAFLLLLDLFEWVSKQFDMQPLAVNLGASNLGGSNEAIAVLLFFTAFAAGTGLLVREIDDRTLSFLDGLPVARLRIFAIKVAVAGMVLLLYPGGLMVMLVVQHLVSRQSLDHAMHAALLWQFSAHICVLAGVGLALGLLLGFLRNLCWLTAGLCVFAVVTVSKVWPGVDVLNPLKLLEMRLVGSQWPLPVTVLVTQLSLLLICVPLAAWFFLGANNGRERKLKLSLSRPLVSATVTLATIAVGIGVFALLASTSEKPAPKPVAGRQSPAVEFVESPMVSARTQRYSFSYATQQAEQAQALLRDADRIHGEVAALLGTGDGARIDVDLSGSQQNTEGTAFYDRIRMHMGKQSRATLAHETAHVLARRLAGGERERELTKMSALNEGLATWIHNKVTGGSGLTDIGRLQAAIVSRRHLVTPAQLTDMETLARESDITLRYPLGAALIDSVVTRYGSEAPKKLLLVLGNPDFPRDLYGMELWFAAFQAAGFDLALVFDDYSRRLKSWESEFAEQIARLPRPRGSLVSRGKQVGVELRFDGELLPDWRAVVRFRPQEDSPLEQYVELRVDERSMAWIPAAFVVNARVCFQPAVRALDVTIPESWVCLPFDSAAAL